MSLSPSKQSDLPDSHVLFHETQRFRQSLMFILIVAGSIPPIIIVGGGMINQLVFGNSFAGMSDRFLIIFGTVSILPAIVGPIVFWFSKLQTQVRRDGLYVRFSPFHFSQRKIPLEKVVSFRALTYRPIWEYGGWGPRWKPSGRAYNVSGREGVRLEFNNGKHLLIGSQKHDQLAAAIETLIEQPPAPNHANSA